MHRFQGMKKSLPRFAVVTVLGMVVALGNPFTADAKEKISKRAMKEMITGAKTAADHKAIADYYYAEAPRRVPKLSSIMRGRDGIGKLAKERRRVPTRREDLRQRAHDAVAWR